MSDFDSADAERTVELSVESTVEFEGDPAVATETDDVEVAPDSGDAVTVFRVMNVEAVTYDLADSSPIAHFIEVEAPFRYMAVPLGLPDAISMHQALSGIEGRRPGTHELMTAVLARAQIDVIAARIVRYEQGVFYAELDLMTPRGHELFDCRTSDAITLALRQSVPSPILCAEVVLAAL